MKYTGKSIDDLQDEIAELLGKYSYMGIIKHENTQHYTKAVFMHMIPIITVC